MNIFTHVNFKKWYNFVAGDFFKHLGKVGLKGHGPIIIRIFRIALLKEWNNFCIGKICVEKNPSNNDWFIVEHWGSYIISTESFSNCIGASSHPTDFLLFSNLITFTSVDLWTGLLFKSEKYVVTLVQKPKWCGSFVVNINFVRYIGKLKFIKIAIWNPGLIILFQTIMSEKLW